MRKERWTFSREDHFFVLRSTLRAVAVASVRFCLRIVFHLSWAPSQVHVSYPPFPWILFHGTCISGSGCFERPWGFCDLQEHSTNGQTWWKNDWKCLVKCPVDCRHHRGARTTYTSFLSFSQSMTSIGQNKRNAAEDERRVALASSYQLPVFQSRWWKMLYWDLSTFR